MQVSSINTKSYYNSIGYNPYPKKNVSNNTPVNNSGVIYNTNIKFSGLNKEYFIKLLSKDPIKEFKNFTKEEYLKLSENQKNKLRAEYQKLEADDPYIYKSLGEMHAYAADCLKQTFDKRFGENNYVVLPIGRSLSSIGKALAIKIGEENVINVPLSNAGRFYPSAPTKEAYEDKLTFIKNNGINNFKKFLEEKHLTKQDIENSNKHYILTDYCVSGFSLKGAEQLFKSDFVWGNKKNNIHSVDFIKLLNTFDEETITPPIKKEMKSTSIHRKLESILYESEYKPFATIDRASTLNDTTDASKAIFNSLTTPKESKLAWFHIIDTIMTGNGDFKVKPVTTNTLDNDIWHPIAPKQKVELWNDVKTQYLSDLRNDINEISKIMIKTESNELKNEKLKQSIDDINGIYNYLINCYKTQNDIKNRFGFYDIRSDIHKIINDINKQLEA